VTSAGEAYEQIANASNSVYETWAVATRWVLLFQDTLVQIPADLHNTILFSSAGVSTIHLRGEQFFKKLDNMEYGWAKLPFFMSKWITMSVAQFEGTVGNMEASAQQTWAITMALACHLPGIKDDATCKSRNIKGNTAKELVSNPEVSEFWSDVKL
jgi:hypothetical protein